MFEGKNSEQCLVQWGKEFVLTLLFFIGASGAAAVTRFQTVVLTIQVTVQPTVQPTVDVQVGVTAEQARLI